MTPADTIAAISSAVGPAARMIVRLSGSNALAIVSGLTPSACTQGEGRGEGSSSANPNAPLPEYREREKRASRSEVRFRDLVVPAWIYIFPAPHSVTGEDVIELHIPGNPLLARMLLDELIRLGARQAEPGEFTARSYFNGRIGLSEAEGVAATIAAHSERELTAARQLLSGELSRRLDPIMNELANTLALVEVGIDFSEEDVSFLSQPQVAHHIDSAQSALQSLLNDSSRFDRLSYEPRIVLVGRPNAGKSMLLNALAETDRAVVSPQAGTTRDILWATARLKRGTVRILDIAGLEEIEPDDPISRSMQSQARRAIEEADLVVLLQDCTDAASPISIPKPIDLHVKTKADLLTHSPSPGTPGEGRGGGDSNVNHGGPHPNPPPEYQGRGAEGISISAMTSANMNLLRERLDNLAFGENASASTLALNARHVRAIEDARAALIRARERLKHSGAEIIALELRESLDCLGQVLGVVTPDEVLGRVFSAFCIGK